MTLDEPVTLDALVTLDGCLLLDGLVALEELDTDQLSISCVFQRIRRRSS